MATLDVGRRGILLVHRDDCVPLVRYKIPMTLHCLGIGYQNLRDAGGFSRPLIGNRLWLPTWRLGAPGPHGGGRMLQ